MEPQLRDHTEPERLRRIDQPLVARRRPADRRRTTTPRKHSIRNKIASAVSVLLLAGLTVVVVRETVTPIPSPIDVAA
ncbi:hypothetical protein F4560_003172 [Saccharothrix ecbatanensis]|uniref:Uncharacterized protein n=1 Tax=Saccharothrix ecbatanensis TaxID=1105145 RepID=A0A7W9HJE3_9PSEU|nr:hypothetical protein [Saccharothrix ecbatanensis]MBB5803404.1 hypothetical protein [Saccharothrix ecbatanensis]